MKFTTVITMALAATAASAQGFAHSCDHNSRRFEDGHKLKITCGNGGSKKTTELDLDKCFMNDGGALRPRSNGKYSGTCSRCDISSLSPTVLYCDCKNSKGDRKGTKIDLQKNLSSKDGKICCGSHCGKETLVARALGSDETHVFEIPEGTDDEEQ